jgi:hypothetical protein
VRCHAPPVGSSIKLRAGEGRAHGNLGNAYRSQGDLSKAIAYHTQDRAIAKEVGDRAGEDKVNGNLGTCHMHLHEYDEVVAYHKAQHALATSLKVAHNQRDSALNVGAHPHPSCPGSSSGPATGADQALGRIATRRHRRAWMTECVGRQSGSWLPSKVVMHLQNCTWRTSPFDAG